MFASIYQHFGNIPALCLVGLVVPQLASALPSEHHHAHHAHDKRQGAGASATLSSTVCVGSGTPFPTPSAWISAKDLMDIWIPIYKDPYQDTDAEINAMVGDQNNPLTSGAIYDGAKSAGMDPRFVAALIGIESWGQTTVQGGLMQDGSQACPSHDACTPDLIKAMITGGMKVAGQCFTQQNQDYGQTARCFNTGHVPNVNDLSVITDSTGTHGRQAYVDRMANFLLGMSPNTQPQTLCGIPIGQ